MNALFPDNTVLCNFAAVHRPDLLRAFLRDRGRWTAAVAAEAQRSSARLPALRSLLVEGWLGEPIDVDEEADTRAVEVIRTRIFGGSVHKPTQHLGEAQTCHIVATWSDFFGSVWISDDRDSLEFADRAASPPGTRSTSCERSWPTATSPRRPAYDLMLDMADANRGLTLPETPRDLL